MSSPINSILNTPVIKTEGLCQPEAMEIQNSPIEQNIGMEIQENSPPPAIQTETKAGGEARDPLITPNLLRNGPVTFAIKDFIKDRKDDRKNSNSVSETSISAQMHSHWLYDAANRVFANPLRAFFEIASNSADAANPDHPIGHLGMGFISILAFLNLADTSGTTIEIVTTYAQDEKENFTYKMTIFLQDGIPHVTFTALPTEEKTGTTVSIIANQGFFKPETLKTILQYVQRLQFYPHSGIKVIVQDKEIILGKGEVRVEVVLKSDKLSSMDFGGGISLDVATSTLFIPSVSKKGEKAHIATGAESPQFVNFAGKEDDVSHLLVRSNGVIFIDIPLQKKFTKGDFLLTLPDGTPVTIARNAIQMTPETKYFLKNLLNQLIQGLLDKKVDSELIHALHISLIAWEKETPALCNWHLSKSLQKLISNTFFSENSRWILFPSEHACFLQPILSRWFGSDFLIPISSQLLEGNFYIIENKIIKKITKHLSASHKENSLEHKAISEQLIAAKAAIGVPDDLLPETPFNRLPTISRFGFHKILFVPVSLFKKCESMIEIEASKAFQFAVSTQYVEDGNICEPVQVTKLEHHSFLKHPSAKNFIVSTSSNPVSIWSNPWLPNPFTNGILDLYDSKPFKIFFKKHALAIAQIAGDIFIDKDASHPLYDDLSYMFVHCQTMIDCLTDELVAMKSLNEQTKNHLKKTLLGIYIYDDEGDFYIVNPNHIESLLQPVEGKQKKVLIEDAKKTKEEVSDEEEVSDAEEDEELDLKQLLNQKKLIPIPHSLVGKKFFEWMLNSCGVSKQNPDVSIYTPEKTLWPPSEPLTVENLEELYSCLVDFTCFGQHKTTLDNNFQVKESQLKIPICESTLKKFHPETFQLLDSFLPFEHQLLGNLKTSIFFNLFFPTYFVRDSLIYSIPLAKEIQQECSSFFNKWHGTLLKYLTINNHQLVHSYGNPPDFTRLFENAQIATMSTNPNYTDFVSRAEDVIEFLVALSKTNPHHIPKLFRFLDALFAEQYSIADRNTALLNTDKLPIFPITAYNAVALLSKLFSKGVAIEYLNAMISQSISHQDLYLSCQLILSADLCPYFALCNSNNTENQHLILKSMGLGIQEILSSPTFGFTKTFFHYSIKEVTYSKNFQFLGIRNFLIEKSLSQTNELQPFINSDFHDQLGSTPSFSVYQLINAVSSESFIHCLKTEDLKEIYVELGKNTKETTNLRLVEQCAEGGTERDSLVAFIIGGLQNARDAYFEFSKKDYLAASSRNQISFKVALCNDKSPQKYAQIHDQVGMTLETLMLDYILPNFSRKKAEDGYVGGMGNEVYQGFKDAEMQTIKTRDPVTQRVYFLKITPVRNEKGKVFDLQLKWLDVTDIVPKSFVGTEIRLLFLNRNATLDQIEFDVFLGNSFIRQTVAMTLTSLSNGAEFKLFLENVKNEKEPLNAFKKDELELDFSKIKKGGTPFKLLHLAESREDGQIAPDGIPSQSIQDFFKDLGIVDPEFIEEFSKGIYFYLPPGSYHSVQARTHIYLEPEKEKEFKEFVVHCIYHKLLQNNSENTSPGPNSASKNNSLVAQKYLPHFKSNYYGFAQIFPNVPCNLSQEELAAGILAKSWKEGALITLERFFVHFKPYYSNDRSFLDFISEFIRNEAPKFQSLRSRLIKGLYMLVRGKSLDNHSVLIEGFAEASNKLIANYIATLDVNSDPMKKHFITTVILGWLSPKFECFKTNIPTISQIQDLFPKEYHKAIKSPQELKQELEIEEASLKLLSVSTFEEAQNWLGLQIGHARKIVRCYCELYSLKHKSPLSLDYSFTFSTTEPFGARYNHSSKTIEYNLAAYRLSHFIGFALGATQKTNLHGLPGARLFLTSLASSGTTNHELKHVLEGKDCQKGDNVHGAGIDPWGRYVHFEALASGDAAVTHQEGLFIDFSEQLAEMFHSVPSLNEDLVKLQQLEKNYPTFVSKLLVSVLLHKRPAEEQLGASSKKQKTDGNSNSNSSYSSIEEQWLFALEGNYRVFAMED